MLTSRVEFSNQNFQNQISPEKMIQIFLTDPPKYRYRSVHYRVVVIKTPPRSYHLVLFFQIFVKNSTSRALRGRIFWDFVKNITSRAKRGIFLKDFVKNRTSPREARKILWDPKTLRAKRPKNFRVFGCY